MMIKMDTDSVRAVASSMQNLAEDFDTRFSSISAAVSGASWQSQAREEFIENLNMVTRAGTASSSALRIMAKATSRKADQWEAVSSVFNGPFYYLEGLWDNFTSALGNTWNNLLGTIGSIRWPTATAIAAIPAVVAIVGFINNLGPSWDSKNQEWRPSNGKLNNVSPVPVVIKAPVVEESVNQGDYSRIAGDVKIGVAGSSEFGYPRNGYNGVQSDCTWFAAQAVSTASDGKFKVSNWGPATNWISSAKDYLGKNPDGFVNSIDTSPAPGDIMQLNIGHVAFVENVETINGKTIITWVEENASGDCKWSGAEQIKVDNNAILRWRITREVDQMSKYNPQFIHINY
jgi:surface antigen